MQDARRQLVPEDGVQGDLFNQLQFRQLLINHNSGNKYNASARELRDHVAVLNIDRPGEDGFYGLHELEVTGGYTSATGGKDLSLTGFDIEVLPDSRLRFMLINHRIPMHYSVEEPATELDPTRVGANSTVEVFELSRGSFELQYKKSIVNDAVYTPNAIAATGDGGFLLTNDHESKVGRVSDTIRTQTYTLTKFLVSGSRNAMGRGFRLVLRLR